MGRRNDVASEDVLAYNNRVQDDAFCKALRAALWAGKEILRRRGEHEAGHRETLTRQEIAPKTKAAR
jgi:hypothetical protein